MTLDSKQLAAAIEEFHTRIAEDREFCEQLYHTATLRCLAAKYAYYVKQKPYIEDYSYDWLETDWYVMGRALDKIGVDDTSPCIDFDFKHPLAEKAIQLAERLIRK